jgi:hypothetical protein
MDEILNPADSIGYSFSVEGIIINVLITIINHNLIKEELKD